MMAADSQASSQYADISRFKGMTLITPTEREARLALRDFESGLVSIGERLREAACATNVVMTLGPEGLMVHAPEGRNIAPIACPPSIRRLGTWPVPATACSRFARLPFVPAIPGKPSISGRLRLPAKSPVSVTSRSTPAHPVRARSGKSLMRALLLAAGIGSRLRPLTNTIPKCLVPIHGRPLLAYWLDLLFLAVLSGPYQHPLPCP